MSFDKPFLTIVTGTVGNIPHLKKNVASIQTQTYKNFKHLIVVDGVEYEEKVRTVINSIDLPQVETQVLVLPENTGANNWFGHRIYGASTFLVNTPWISFLDEDNFINYDYVEKIMKTIEKNKDLDWCWCKRNMVNETGEFIVKDSCESMGTQCPIWDSISINTPLHFIDSNCWIWRRDFLMKFVNLWFNKGYQYPPTDPDRLFSFYLINNVSGQQVKSKNIVIDKHLINYTMDPKRAKFYKDGNLVVEQLKINFFKELNSGKLEGLVAQDK